MNKEEITWRKIPSINGDDMDYISKHFNCEDAGMLFSMGFNILKMIADAEIHFDATKLAVFNEKNIRNARYLDLKELKVKNK